MKWTEIEYTVDGGKPQYLVVREEEGWEANYLQNVLNRIESIVTAQGVKAVVTGIKQHT